MQAAQRRIKRIGIAIGGAAVLLMGVIAIPYPGPGWLIVFAGLAILATEFAWAKRVLEFVRYHYDRWNIWLKRQHVFVRLLVVAFTFAVVVMTLWLLNVYGTVEGLLHLNMPWLHSPLGMFAS